MSQNDHKAAIDWTFEGEKGTSSETICRAFLGRPAGMHDSLPSDPSDLARCRLFLEVLSPEGRYAALQRVATRYADWTPLVRDWDKVCAEMDKEAPTWRDPHGKRWGDHTYKMMGVLRVEGLRLRYPNAFITTRADGTLSSLVMPNGPIIISLGGKASS